MSSVDNLKQLRELLWCDHSGVALQAMTEGYTHVAVYNLLAVHIVVEQGKVKILCHACYILAMKVRFKLPESISE